MSVLRRRWRWIAVAFVALAAWVRMGPLPAGLLDLDAHPSVVIADRFGEVLYEVRGPDGIRAEALTAGRLPASLVNATLAAEDARFYSHVGIDPIAVVRAAVQNLRARRVVQGGSTLSQQVAKLLLARREGSQASRGWLAKWREAIVALRLEHRLTKAEILTLYLNLAPYGNQITGAGRAARAYFGRDVATLTAAESAFLAALPQQPSRFNPWRDARLARPRQQRILRTMAARGWLGDADLVTALDERVAVGRETTPMLAPHFVERVVATVRESSDPTAARRIDTTLDATLQRMVQGIISAHRAELDAHRAANVAVAVLDNHTGEWLAWEGSGNYTDAARGGAIDGVMTPRQPGSALKPFTYAAAFERGFHPAVVLADVPSQFPTAEPGILYSPRNYDGQFRGPLSIRASLAGSENVPAVAVASEIGVPAVLRLLRRSGFTTLDRTASHYGLGITLGNAEVRLAEMITAYSLLARGGERVTPRSIRAVNGRAGAAPPAVRVVSERTAFWLTDILADAEARAYIFGRGGSLEFPFTVAAKTGTSQAYHDNWAIGFTRDVTVGVWVGNFDRTPLGNSSGVTGAGPIFHDVMIAAVERQRGRVPIDEFAPILAPTADVHRGEVCALSGMHPSAACPRRTTEWLPRDATAAICTWHHDSDEGTVTVLPSQYAQWLERSHLRSASSGGHAEGLRVRAAEGLRHDRRDAGRERTPTAEDSNRRTVGPSDHRTVTFQISSPLPGATFLLDPTLRSEFQTLPLRTTGASGPVAWFVNGAAIGTASADQPIRWPMAKGKHELRARDAAGRTAQTTIVVR